MDIDAETRESYREAFVSIMNTTVQVLQVEKSAGGYGKPVEEWIPIRTLPARILQDAIPVPASVGGSVRIIYSLEAAVPWNAEVLETNRIRVGELDYHISSMNADKPDRLSLHLSLRRTE